ncbi:unnamed protein product [Gadus morhua 'NCC']|jgi:hypothetical protein
MQADVCATVDNSSSELSDQYLVPNTIISQPRPPSSFLFLSTFNTTPAVADLYRLTYTQILPSPVGPLASRPFLSSLHSVSPPLSPSSCLLFSRVVASYPGGVLGGRRR